MVTFGVCRITKQSIKCVFIVFLEPITVHINNLGNDLRIMILLIQITAQYHNDIV